MLVAGAKCDTELNLRKIRMIHYATRHYDSLCDTKPRMLVANDLVTDAHSLAPEARPLLSHPSLCSGVTPALRIFWRAERGVAAGTLTVRCTLYRRGRRSPAGRRGGCGAAARCTGCHTLYTVTVAIHSNGRHTRVHSCSNGRNGLESCTLGFVHESTAAVHSSVRRPSLFLCPFFYA